MSGGPTVGLAYMDPGFRQGWNEMTVLGLERQIPKSANRKDENAHMETDSLLD